MAGWNSHDEFSSVFLISESCSFHIQERLTGCDDQSGRQYNRKGGTGKILLRKRRETEEVTLDMATCMGNMARFLQRSFGHRSFPCAETRLRWLA